MAIIRGQVTQKERVSAATNFQISGNYMYMQKTTDRNNLGKLNGDMLKVLSI